MIPKKYILEWKDFAPWINNAQIEQDLLIHRAIISIFSNNFLKEKLAFRGGTALYKLFIQKPVRYSEDIDLVQIKPEPIGAILDEIKKSINFFEKKPKIKVKANNHNVIYTFITEFEPNIPMKLKIEINCREHFSILGYLDKDFSIKNSWINDSVQVTTYKLEELIATKLRALYQRKKGRDLFDLYYVLKNKDIDIQTTINCFYQYMEAESNKITKQDIIKNLESKLVDNEFTGDIFGLLLPEINYDNNVAYDYVKEKLISKM